MIKANYISTILAIIDINANLTPNLLQYANILYTDDRYEFT